MRYRRSEELYHRAVKVIPGGIYGHKNPDFILPGHSPYYADRARGGRYWDVDGNEYLDLLCGYGPILLGHNHPQVEEAVAQQMAKGNCFNQPGAVMVELAERLVDRVPGMDWALFAKNGSDVTTWAVRVAREYTGRPKIVTVRDTYHGAHAWCSVYPGGVLPEDKVHILEMGWGRLDELEALVTEYQGQLAAIIAAPYHHPVYADQQLPVDGYWSAIRQICDREGMLLILDDIRAGFRLHPNGNHVLFGIEPDLICFGKSLANGHPISVAMGREALRAAAEQVFISGTFWFAPAPMVAAQATLKILDETAAIDHMAHLGQRLGTGLRRLAEGHGLPVTVSGPPALPYMTFDGDRDLDLMRLFCREMIARGVFLHPHHNWFLCATHTEEDIAFALEMAGAAFELVGRNA
jgi:glutamate-1-semialdehyde 2,1-aminomutase